MASVRRGRLNRRGLSYNRWVWLMSLVLPTRLSLNGFSVDVPGHLSRSFKLGIPDRFE